MGRSLPILLVYPVDKIVQGMWKNFLPLLTTLSEIISKDLSKAYENARMRGKGTKPFENFVLSSPEGGVFPTFSTKVVKKLAKPLFFLNVTSMAESCCEHASVCFPGQPQPGDTTVHIYSAATT